MESESLGAPLSAAGKPRLPLPAYAAKRVRLMAHFGLRPRTIAVALGITEAQARWQIRKSRRAAEEHGLREGGL